MKLQFGNERRDDIDTLVVDTLPIWVDNFNDTQFEYHDLSQTLGQLKHQVQGNEVWLHSG
jgi:hypothetical protein